MDIAPELYDRVHKAFKRYVADDRRVKKVLDKVEKGTADYEDAYTYATAVGECLSRAFSLIEESELPDGRMFYNIAQRVIRPLLEEADYITAEISDRIQKTLNEKAGIGLNPV